MTMLQITAHKSVLAGNLIALNVITGNVRAWKVLAGNVIARML